MAQQLSFEISDFYTMKIWNPLILDDSEPPRSLSGEHFFSVIYSVYREVGSPRKNVSASAEKILEKMVAELGSLETEYKTHVSVSENKKAECPFSVTNVAQDSNQITIDNISICPQNAVFLRVFLLFDRYIGLLSELESMAIIDKNEYFVIRKNAQQTLRGIMEGYNAIIKRFHAERKRTQQDNQTQDESLKETSAA